MSGSGSITPEALLARVGTAIGVSSWREISQDLIDRFADATGDRQFIHVDKERAAGTPFGGTVAHGFLTLSLLTSMAEDVLPPVAGQALGLNYGFDKVRFLAPVPSGARIRARFILNDVVRRPPADLLLRQEVTVEIENGNRPALVAEWLTLIRLG